MCQNPGSGQDYVVLNDTEVQFSSSVTNASSEVAMHVFFVNAGAGGTHWRNPVSSVGQLSTAGNSDGDIAFVIDEELLYTWDEDTTSWVTLNPDLSNLDLDHDELADMPDSSGVNPDHDERYYTETEMDSTVTDLQDQIDNLTLLTPKDADELSGDMNYSHTNLFTGYLSGGVGQNFDTLLSYSSFNKIITDANFKLLNPDQSEQFNDADKGTLELYVNNVKIDEFDLATPFSELLRATGQVYPPAFGGSNKIEIVSVGPYNGYAVYQIGDFKINLSPSDLIQGENSFKVIHKVGVGEYSTNDYILFYDNSTENIVFSSMSISEDTISSAKYLSGVRHYNKNDKLNIQFTCSRLFNNTYAMPNQINIDPTDIAVNSYYINYQSTGVQGSPTPNIDTDVVYSKILTLSQNDVYTVSPRIRLRGYDTFGGHAEFQSPSQSILINTYLTQSTDKFEYFLDEYYRLDESLSYDSIPGSYFNVWNSTTVLVVDQLQVYDNKLIYPEINFTSGYLPSQTANYSGFSGDRYYVRAFIDSDPHTNGVFYIENYTIPNTVVKIELKLPTQTGWLDLSLPYNVADFTGADGDGCLISNDGYNFYWTAGGFSTANSGNIVILRVTMTDSFITTDSIPQISINW